MRGVLTACYLRVQIVGMGATCQTACATTLCSALEEANGIAEVGGLKPDAFDQTTVANQVGALPAAMSAVVTNAVPTVVTLTYNASITSGTPTPADFTVVVAGSVRAHSKPAFSFTNLLHAPLNSTSAPNSPNLKSTMPQWRNHS